MSIRSFDRKNLAGGSAPAPEAKSSFGASLLRVAWLTIVLGLAMEVLLLLVIGFGDATGLQSFAADLVQKVSWSALVCAGLAVGATLSKIRLPVMGLSGFSPLPSSSRARVASIKGLLFPVGCSLVLYSAGAVGEKAA